MSLVGPYFSNKFNVRLPDSYTTIISLIVEKRPIFWTPQDNEEPKIRSNHQFKIETNTWASKEDKDAGKSPIEFHTYYIPYEYLETDIFTYAYLWLKENVKELENCIDD